MINIWNNIFNDLSNNPRDLQTIPLLNRTPVWFNASANQDLIFVTKAKDDTLDSNVKGTRKLDFNEFKRIYPLYIKRKEGKKISKEATKVSRNSSYWFSIIEFCS